MNRQNGPAVHAHKEQPRHSNGFKGLLSAFVPKKLIHSVNENSKARAATRRSRDEGKTDVAARTETSWNRGRTNKEEQLDFSGMGLKSTKGLSLFRSVKKPEGVECVYLDHNGFESLPEDLSRCLQLRVLSATDNDLNSVPRWIASLIALSDLDLRKNNIQCLPESFKCLKRLSVLNLSFNPLTSVDHSLVHCSNLTMLNLNDCCLQYLPATIGRLHRLQVLEIRNNSLQSLPVGIGRLGRLELLDIGGNRLMHLPETMDNLGNLKILLADENRLMSLPEKLDGLSSLEFFDLSRNELTELSSSVEKLTALETLLVVENRLAALPDALCNLRNLKLFRADRNGLRQMPHGVGKLSLLKELSAAANELSELPESFCSLGLLEAVFLDQNRLRALPDQLGDLKNLSILSLRGNAIQSLPSTVGNLSRLVSLDLRENQLRFLPSGMKGLTGLRALWLRHNQATPKLTLHSEVDLATRQKVLTCYLLPQENQPYGRHQSCPSVKKTQSGRRITFEQQKDPPVINPTKKDHLIQTQAVTPASFPNLSCPPATARALEVLGAQHEIDVRIETSFGSLVRQAKVIKTGKISPRLLYQLDKIKHEQRRSAMFQSSALTIVRNRLDFSCTSVTAESSSSKCNLGRPPSLIRPYAMIDLKTLQAQVDAERRTSMCSVRNGPTRNGTSSNHHEYEAIFDLRKNRYSVSAAGTKDRLQYFQGRAYTRCNSCLKETTEKEGCEDVNNSL